MIPNRFKRIAFMAKAILLSPIFYSMIWSRARRRNKEKPLRILVIPQLTRLGDLVCATPVFAAIKKKYPQSFLAVLTTDKVEGIIRNNPHIDQILLYKSNDLGGLVQKIRSLRFDWSFTLPVSPFGLLLSFVSLIPRRAKLMREGRPASEIMTDWLSNAPLRYYHHTYLPHAYVELLEYIHIHNPGTKKEVYIDSESEKRVAAFLSEHGVRKSDRLVGISIAAGNAIKEWGDEKFTELASHIRTVHRARVLFLGTGKDGDRVDAIRKSLGDDLGCIKATGFSLMELPALLNACTLFIAVDTGPIYIAHALGVPLIDITGPVDIREQPPEDERSILIAPEGVPPSSFVFKKPGSAEERRRAVEAIPVSQVAAGVDDMMKMYG
ncbi:MAG: hypothetical protein COU47_01945 [Candidatus Niyogibacteria bacterium CG10_big_fil_rev_8_21_14_0_10_46_36]|uniref:Glycosyltransferase family 9 protein n=1 Tax=Candidatus Niyogibacteria bacterium CG10_big_fil_rev_8_21_14_0_10_46_36 TaxID=1974726 RepID=A0A2H0TDL6_9BACT|nr:MAG: hypothetical protein COU47_01945 [Candidatus Niyogibacteria bacterium CG10_big_fil_rev_8_21_14_0_10_46_36]